MSTWLCKIMLSHLQRMDEGQQLDHLEMRLISSLFSSSPRCAVVMRHFSLGKPPTMALQAWGQNLPWCLGCAFSSSCFTHNEISQGGKCSCAPPLCSHPALGNTTARYPFLFYSGNLSW